ncbi:Sirohydrochlorin ferrochelatase [Citrus sinensis]|uniref:Sirohydrochlorin ferrochelatase n=1 Tax=Citrus sinensis TaxID=2711 RepID=A0ACB8MZ13_CITSI|nr:Sirohydrochlorin ferrochelatase [Citrus sinensis]
MPPWASKRHRISIIFNCAHSLQNYKQSSQALRDSQLLESGSKHVCGIAGEVGTKNPIWVHPNSLNFQRGPSRTKHLSIKSSSRDGVGDKDGVIIVDHGSRRRESNLMLKQFVAMFREKTGYLIVEPAHMELAEPSIKDAFGSCVQQGANRVIDIPSLTAEAAKEHPGVPYIVTAPLGLHEQLVDVVNDRIKHCLSHAVGDADECVVCAGTNRCRLYGAGLANKTE